MVTKKWWFIWLFAALVDQLRNGIFLTNLHGCILPMPLGNDRLQELAVLTWELVGHQITPFAVTNVSSMHFYADSFDVACVVSPMNWPIMYMNDPIMQTGAVLFVGSQAQDFWNQQIREGALERAGAYESQFLLQVQKLVSGWTPNEYQQQILDAFPEGLNSLPENLRYIPSRYPR